jgi:hypothetical protein
MEEIFYTKKNGRYTPVTYYDSEVMNGFPEGATIVMVDSHSSTRRYRIDPAFAPLIAAGILAEDIIATAIMEGSKAELRDKAVTQEEANAWDMLRKTMGQSVYLVQFPAAQQSARAGVKAMQDEASKMLAHPTVKAAYDQFLTVWQLIKEQEK